jgi:3-dehydroquinate dehydratase II
MPETRKPIAVINGPNLNRLGRREPALYGSASLADVELLCALTAESFGWSVETFQSNSEGDLIDRVQRAEDENSAIVINAGGYSHTSIALGDALRATTVPVIEVHVTNVARREEYRHQSFVAAAARGTVAGLGIDGYRLAIDYLCHLGDEVELGETPS